MNSQYRAEKLTLDTTSLIRDLTTLHLAGVAFLVAALLAGCFVHQQRLLGYALPLAVAVSLFFAVRYYFFMSCSATKALIIFPGVPAFLVLSTYAYPLLAHQKEASIVLASVACITLPWTLSDMIHYFAHYAARDPRLSPWTQERLSMFSPSVVLSVVIAFIVLGIAVLVPFMHSVTAAIFLVWVVCIIFIGIYDVDLVQLGSHVIAVWFGYTEERQDGLWAPRTFSERWFIYGFGVLPLVAALTVTFCCFVPMEGLRYLLDPHFHFHAPYPITSHHFFRAPLMAAPPCGIKYIWALPVSFTLFVFTIPLVIFTVSLPLLADLEEVLDASSNRREISGMDYRRLASGK